MHYFCKPHKKIMLEGKDYFIAKTCSAMHIITFSLCIIKSKLHLLQKHWYIFNAEHCYSSSKYFV